MPKTPRPPKGVVPAKVGTVPYVVVFDRRGCWKVGARVRIRYGPGGVMSGFKNFPWRTGILDQLDPIFITLF